MYEKIVPSDTITEQTCYEIGLMKRKPGESDRTYGRRLRSASAALTRLSTAWIGECTIYEWVEWRQSK